MLSAPSDFFGLLLLLRLDGSSGWKFRLDHFIVECCLWVVLVEPCGFLVLQIFWIDGSLFSEKFLFIFLWLYCLGVLILFPCSSHLTPSGVCFYTINEQLFFKLFLVRNLEKKKIGCNLNSDIHIMALRQQKMEVM